MLDTVQILNSIVVTTTPSDISCNAYNSGSIYKIHCTWLIKFPWSHFLLHLCYWISMILFSTSILLNFCDHSFYLNYPASYAVAIAIYIRNVQAMWNFYVHVVFNNFCSTTVICAIQDLGSMHKIYCMATWLIKFPWIYLNYVPCYAIASYTLELYSSSRKWVGLCWLCWHNFQHTVIGAGKHKAYCQFRIYFYKKHKVKRADLFEIPDHKV